MRKGKLRLTTLAIMCGLCSLCMPALASVSYELEASGKDEAAALGNLKMAAVRKHLQSILTADEMKKNASKIRSEIFLNIAEFASEEGEISYSSEGGKTKAAGSVSVDDTEILARLTRIAALKDKVAALQAAAQPQNQDAAAGAAGTETADAGTPSVPQTPEPAATTAEQTESVAAETASAAAQPESAEAEPQPQDSAPQPPAPADTAAEQTESAAAETASAGAQPESAGTEPQAPDSAPQPAAVTAETQPAAAAEPDTSTPGTDSEGAAAGTQTAEVTDAAAQPAADNTGTAPESTDAVPGDTASSAAAAPADSEDAGNTAAPAEATEAAQSASGSPADADANAGAGSEEAASAAAVQSIDLISLVKNPASTLDDILKALADGANPDQPDKYGRTALFAACENGNTEIIKALLAHKANVNHTDQNGDTALVKAIEDGHDNDAVIKLLLDSGADPNVASGQKSKPALIAAVRSERTGLVRPLLDAGAKVDAELKNGRTALSYAFFDYADNLPLEMIGTLLDAGANPNHPDSNQITPMILAIAAGSVDAVKLLVAKGGDLKQALDTVLDGETVYQQLMSSDMPELSELKQYVSTHMK